MRKARTKIVARSNNGTQHWLIWDNGDVDFLKNRGEYHCQNENISVDSFLNALKKLIPNKNYRFLNWQNGEQHFIDDIIENSNRGVPVVFLGFDPVKCKECGFETDLKVCPNCGEWK